MIHARGQKPHISRQRIKVKGKDMTTETSYKSININIQNRQDLHRALRSIRNAVHDLGKIEEIKNKDLDTLRRLEKEIEDRLKTIKEPDATISPEITIKELREKKLISNRLANTMERYKIETLKEIQKYTEQDIRSFYQMGETSIRQLEMTLIAAGLSFKP